MLKIINVTLILGQSEMFSSSQQFQISTNVTFTALAIKITENENGQK